MKLSNVTEYGCYIDFDGEAIYQVMPNTDKIWLEEEPDVKILVDTFYFAYEKHGLKTYTSNGNCQRISDPALGDIDVTKVNNYALIDPDTLREVRHYGG